MIARRRLLAMERLIAAPLSGRRWTAAPTFTSPAAPIDMFAGLVPPASAFATPAPTSEVIEAIEAALTHILLGERALAEIAARIRVSRPELERLVAAYRAAGRRTAP